MNQVTNQEIIPGAANGRELQFIDEEAKSLNRRAFKNGPIVTLILMVIWALVLEFIPEGWWVLAINILGILLTAWILLSTAIPVLKVHMPTLIAVIASGALWFVMFVAIRFIIGAVLGTN